MYGQKGLIIYNYWLIEFINLNFSLSFQNPMNLSYESSFSNILQLSQQEDDNNKMDYLHRFVNNLHSTYGIPIEQLQDIYSNRQLSTQSNISSNNHYDMGRQLDYGDKVHINHNILKKMVEMIDKKIQSRGNKSFFSKYKSKMLEVNQYTRQELQKAEKMIEVRSKLIQVIEYIDNAEQCKFGKRQENMIEGLTKIKEEPSLYELSLQYSKDASDFNHSYKMSIDSHFDFNEKAKETTSQIMTQNQDNHRQKQTGLYHKKSLERISQVVSGQSLQRQPIPLQNNSHQTSVNKSFNDTNNRIQNDDDTRQMILNTIANKTKTSHHFTSKEYIKEQDYDQHEKRNSIKNESLNNFNKINPKKGLWESYSKNTLTSYESLDDVNKKDKNIKNNPFNRYHPIYQSKENTNRVSNQFINTANIQRKQNQKQNQMMFENAKSNRKISIEHRGLIEEPNVVVEYPAQKRYENSNYQSYIQRKDKHVAFPAQHVVRKDISFGYNHQNHQSLPKNSFINNNISSNNIISNNIGYPYQVIRTQKPQIYNPSSQSMHARTSHSQPLQRREVYNVPVARPVPVYRPAQVINHGPTARSVPVFTPAKFDFRQRLSNNPQGNMNTQSFQNKLPKPIQKVSIIQKPLKYNNQTQTINHNFINQSRITQSAVSNRNQHNVSPRTHLSNTVSNYQHVVPVQQPVKKQAYAEVQQLNRQQVEKKRLDYSIVNKFQPWTNSLKLQKIAEITEKSGVSSSPRHDLSTFARHDSDFRIDLNQSKSKINSFSSTRRLKKKGINLTQPTYMSQKLFRN